MSSIAVSDGPVAALIPQTGHRRAVAADAGLQQALVSAVNPRVAGAD